MSTSNVATIDRSIRNYVIHRELFEPAVFHLSWVTMNHKGHREYQNFPRLNPNLNTGPNVVMS